MRSKQSRSHKIYQQVAEEIIQMIETGHLNPGDKLPPLNQLAKQFGVSRATVREAFSTLQGMGLIALRHGEGTFVQQIDLETMIQVPMNAALLLGRNELLSLHEIRELLEVGACRMAASRATDTDIQEMEQALQAFECTDEDMDAQVQADLSFHLAVSLATHNPVLINMMQILAEAIKSVMRMQRTVISIHQASADYRQIVNAIRLRDEIKAQRAMSEYLKRVQQAIVFGKGKQHR